MSEQFMSQQQYMNALTPNHNLVAELRDIAHRLDYVLAHAGGKLDACELHELCRASRQTDELMDALATPA